MQVIYSKTGKKPKKGTGAGRPKKRQINWEEFTRDEMVKIIEWYIERDERDEKKKQNIKDSQSLKISSRKKSKLFGFSRFDYFENKKSMNKNKEFSIIDSIIKKSFYETKGIF